MKVILVILVIITRTLSSKVLLCDKETSVDITRGTHIDGDVFYKGIKYSNNQYYIDNETDTVRGCICRTKTCVRKCCPINQAYHTKAKKCVDVDQKFEMPVWDDYRHTQVGNATSMFHFVFGKVNCTQKTTRIRIGQATSNTNLLMDGKLYIHLPASLNPWLIRDPDEYCMDTFVIQDADGHETTTLDSLVCFPQDSDDSDSIPSVICMLISCVFILATVAVYAWLPELRNLHGRVLMAYLICLFIGFLFLATMKILLALHNIEAVTCVVFTFIIYYSLEAAFFWLNVMSFDIWWTFSGKRGMSLQKLTTKARFSAYALYAFGIPTALTFLLMGLEFSGLPYHPLLPLLRANYCFISGRSKLLYLYGPITILCVANMVFFILTAVKITQIKQQTAVLKSNESSTHDPHRKDKQRLWLYIKLFIVMGVNWILEVVSALDPNTNIFWRFTDAYNVLIGVFIFIMFVCKRKIFRLIKKRYKQLRGDPISRSQTTTSRTLSSRDDNIQMESIKKNGK